MSNKTNMAVKEAERLLQQHAYDAAHDLAHHQSVYATAQRIAQHVTDTFDPELLQIACMWHDVVLDGKDADQHKNVTLATAEHVRDYMLSLGFDDQQAQTVFLAIRYHEFDDKPVNTEGKILFDADKLDTINIDRIRRIATSDRLGNVPAWKIKAYAKGATMMIKHMRQKFHYDYTRQLFDEIVDVLWDDPELEALAQKYGIDSADVKRSLRKTTFLDRLLALIKR